MDMWKRRPSSRFKWISSITLLACITGSAAVKPVRLSVSPADPLLFGKDSRQRLIAVISYSDGTSKDVTADARFVSAKTAVATVDKAGLVTAHANGGSLIDASYSGLHASTTVLVQRAEAPLPVSFAGDILPVLTKNGCNSGSCHGALNGQNGFKLSLFGYEPENDYEMIVHKHDGRRLDLSDPEKSLLLLKPTFQVKHGGGKRFAKDSPDYATLFNWIRNGAHSVPAQERRMVALSVNPSSTVLFGKDAKGQLLVTARYSDGTEGDVTQLVKFQSNDDSIASVDPQGVVAGIEGGETAIVVRGPGTTGVAIVDVVPDSRPVRAFKANNFIDEYVIEKLQRLHIPASEPADDATFLRRAFLDIIGVIPTSSEARQYLNDRDPDKRAKLVESLLHRPEYADFWTLYWGDHLNNTKQLLYNKGPYTFTIWLNRIFRDNVPYDKFARMLLTSTGNTYDAPEVSFYPEMKKELDRASTTTQLFLGVSIECARCHNHPLEHWTREDFNGMAAFFSQIRFKEPSGPRNNEKSLYLDFKREFQHPDTKLVSLPKPLNGPVMVSDDWTDRRELLADWMTSPKNPYFARTLINRMWRNFMGRGLVEPVDDFRATNPSTNGPLLDALAKDFVEHGYDLHQLIRRITSSATYQLSSIPAEGNKRDKMAYSRYYPRRLSAEQMLDSIVQSTGVPESFRSQYPGTRAAQLAEPEIESYFLDVFDRPSRQLICERKQPPTLNQALHLITGDTVQKKITDPRSILRATRNVEEMYLRTLSRYPDAGEQSAAEQAITKAGDPKRGYEDLLWALLNSKEFLYNH
jgi:hypothetical protein